MLRDRKLAEPNHPPKFFKASRGRLKKSKAPSIIDRCISLDLFISLISKLGPLRGASSDSEGPLGGGPLGGSLGGPLGGRSGIT